MGTGFKLRHCVIVPKAKCIEMGSDVYLECNHGNEHHTNNGMAVAQCFVCRPICRKNTGVALACRQRTAQPNPAMQRSEVIITPSRSRYVCMKWVPDSLLHSNTRIGMLIPIPRAIHLPLTVVIGHATWEHQQCDGD